MTFSSGFSVAASVLIGVIGDLRANRKTLVIITSVAALIGNLAMLIHPGVFSLILAHGVMFPWRGAFWGQSFALAGLVMAGQSGRDGVQAVIRAGCRRGFWRC